MKKNMQCQGLKHLHLNFSTVFGDHCNILLKIVAINSKQHNNNNCNSEVMAVTIIRNKNRQHLFV